jgi:hypothetical protein
MKIEITLYEGRLTASVAESRNHSPRELLTSTPTDPRAADQISALVARLVGIAVHDAIIREAGGTDGAA